MGTDRLLERDARFLVLPLSRVDHGEIVIRLGKLRIILRELGEEVDRFLGVALIGEDQSLQEARLWIAWLRGKHLVDALERLLMLSGFQHAARILEIVGACGEREKEACA